MQTITTIGFDIAKSVLPVHLRVPKTLSALMR